MLLLIRADDDLSRANQPDLVGGGRKDMDLSGVTLTMVREAKNETGVNILNYPTYRFLDTDDPSQQGPHRNIRTFFVVKFFEDVDIQLNPNEHKAHLWVNHELAPDLLPHPVQQRAARIVSNALLMLRLA